jgi:hypothetical protein
MKPLNLKQNFDCLSIKDLLEARNSSHYYLMNKKNVIGTALGLYRIRKSEVWPSKEKPTEEHKGNKGKRTLFNSEVRPYSWPCIYVFVKEWSTEEKLSETSPSDVVPKTLYLSDGRNVPVCVIEAHKQRYSEDAKINMSNVYPRNLLTPGIRIINENLQGIDRVATVGCIVKDSKKYYALSNSHATCDEGTKIKSYKNEDIGVTSAKGLGKELFADIYPNFPFKNQYLQMDIGLVEINDITKWKTNLLNYGAVENPIDLYDNNMSLRLIGEKVVGHGGISGSLKGEIHGLFYRYKSMGGYEYLCDFLIGPDTDDNSHNVKKNNDKNVNFNIHHGDSGTLLLIEEQGSNYKDKKKYYPFAILWGKHEFIKDGVKQFHPYGLATSLSSILNKLDLDFVNDINLDNDYIWGFIGHYAIGNKLSYAIDLLGSNKLKQFVKKNLDLLAMKEDEIKAVAPSPRVIQKNDDGTYDIETIHFVPLADVPDNVWKSNVNFYMEAETKKRVSGMGSRGQNDNPNHFADIDLEDDNHNTLLKLSLDDPDKNLNTETWLGFYQSMKEKYDHWNDLLGKSHDREQKHWGALPFRVWQIFDEMVKFAADGKQEEFLCAGGVLIHYLGDACQPLHASYLSQGDPDDVITRANAKTGEDKTEMRAENVHSGYEDEMIDANVEAIMNNLEKQISNQENGGKEKIVEIKNGYDAAFAVIKLIEATQSTISPREIVDLWVEVKSLPKKERIEKMWDSLGDRTIVCMARGTRYLAAIWDAAWQAGDGEKKIGVGSRIKEENLMKLYNNTNFLPSISLDKYKLKKL